MIFDQAIIDYLVEEFKKEQGILIYQKDKWQCNDQKMQLKKLKTYQGVTTQGLLHSSLRERADQFIEKYFAHY